MTLACRKHPVGGQNHQVQQEKLETESWRRSSGRERQRCVGMNLWPLLSACTRVTPPACATFTLSSIFVHKGRALCVQQLSVGAQMGVCTHPAVPSFLPGNLFTRANATPTQRSSCVCMYAVIPPHTHPSHLYPQSIIMSCREPPSKSILILASIWPLNASSRGRWRLSFSA